jgi:hypothetical protein
LTIDSPRAGQSWSIREARQGVQFFSGRRTTDAQGNIVLTTSPREVNGVTDVYTAQARNLGTGETCTARVALPG